MRTTLTLDDDVAAKLKSESQRAGRPFREIVNETLLRGLESRRATAQRRAFKVTARDLGNLKPGLSPGQYRGAHRACGGLASPVILVDANLLLYAYHPRAEQHEESRAWLEAVLSGPELVRFAWLTLWPSSGSRQILACSNVRFPRPKPKRRFPLGSTSRRQGFSTRANGT